MAVSIRLSDEELSQMTTSITKDINLSMKKAGIPTTLSLGPWTINYLNQLRLLAYSPHIQERPLKPKDSGSFEHLKSFELSPAIVQVVVHATDAFQTADTNMALVMMEAQSLFGRSGPAQGVLVALQDPYGGKRAAQELARLKDGVKNCSSRTEQISTAFGKVIDTSHELFRSITEEAVYNEREQNRIQKVQKQREDELKVESYLLDEYKKLIEREERSLKKAETAFEKADKHSDLKALGLKTLYDIQGVFSGTLGAAVNLVKETPNIAITGLKAVGNVGNLFSTSDREMYSQEHSKNQGGEAPKVASPAADPGLHAADEIQSQISRLQDVIQGGLPRDLQSGETRALTECVAQMQVMQKTYLHSQASNAALAASVLKQAVAIGNRILEVQRSSSTTDPEGEGWRNRVREWHESCEGLNNHILALRAYATTQAGQGFGNTTSASPSDLNGVNLQSVVEQRQIRLSMRQKAMEHALDDLKSITSKTQAMQTKIIQLSHQMKQLDYSKATLADTKKALHEAIDILFELRSGFDQIKKTFDIFAGFLNIRIARGSAQSLENALQGATERSTDGQVLCSQIEARTVIDMVIQMRGHFMYIFDMATLYSSISNDYIMPCVRNMSQLKINSTPTQQREQQAKLEKLTEQFSKSIMKRAEADLEMFEGELTKRSEEIGREVVEQGAGLPISASRAAAIEGAVASASKEALREVEDRINEAEKKIVKSSKAIGITLDDDCFA